MVAASVVTLMTVVITETPRQRTMRTPSVVEGVVETRSGAVEDVGVSSRCGSMFAS